MSYSATTRLQSDIDKMVISRRADDMGLLTLDSPTTIIGANATTLNVAVTHGFVFVFDGDEDYSSIYVSACGVVQILTNTTTSGNADLFAANTKILIAPWYDAMKTAETVGYVKTEVQGTAPFRRIVIEWLCYSSSADSAANNDLLNFQCVLYETTDRFEFRYAPRVRTGSPTAATASVGFKGDTSGTATNYRDLSVDNRTLGGSNTTSATTLTVTAYDALVTGGCVRVEPNWPMCGRAFMIDPDSITGLDLYDDVIWKIANFVNWLWCAHTPALVNFSPYQQTGYASVDYVIPCVASDEGLSYDVYVEVYASAGANCTVYVDADNVADPQPGAGGDWSNITSSTQAVAGAAWAELTKFTATIPADAEYLQITVTVTAGTVIVGSVLIVPTVLADVDVAYTSLTGFVPMAIGALRANGAGVYAEWYNRAWMNIAHILRDRRQMVWSSVWPELSKVSLVSTTPRPVRTIGVSKAAIPGFRGADAKARIYARDTTGGAPLQLSESGNGLLAEWTVDANGGEYRAQSTDVALISDEPLITATCDPVGTLSPMSVLVDWSPDLSTDNLFAGVTPAPKLALLLALVRRMDKALRTYAYCGLATMLARGKTSTAKWRTQTWVGPAVKALRPKVTRDQDDASAASVQTLIFAASSGSGASDEVYIDSPFTRGRDDYPPEGAIDIGIGAEFYDAAPGITGLNRLLESPTLNSMTGGARERIEIVHGVGLTVIPVAITGADLLAL